MSAAEAPKPVEGGTVEPAPAPVLAPDNTVAPVEEPKTGEAPVTEGEAVAPVEENKEEVREEKAVEPIYSGALGYKAPGLKNAFRFAKKHFWFGEEPVPSSNLTEYLRGEKPEVAHPVVAWSSQTGKGLLFFVKHADQKEHPAGVLNLAYATDLVKDGTNAFAFKLSGHKHTFEAQNTAERDGWFVAVERAITEAKAAKDGIESSEGYKENKEKISKPTALAGAATSPKKSIDATDKLAEGETAGAEVPTVVAPPRAGSASSSSSDEEKKAKKAKNKSRSVSRKRASIFGGFGGKKDKKNKDDGEAVKAEPEVKNEDAAAAPQLGEASTAPVITQDIPNAGEEMKTEATPAPVGAVGTEEVKAEETPVAMTQDKPKPTKRGSIFGSFVEKIKSPTHEKKQHELLPATTKEADAENEASKPLEEAEVAAPAGPTVSEPASEAVKADEVKPVATGTPSKEKEHFSFGKFFGGSKERSKSPAAAHKAPEHKVDAAPRIEDTTTPAPAAAEPIEPVDAATPVTEDKAVETPKTQKRASFFGNLTRSLSKATGAGAKKEQAHQDKKDTPATLQEAEETASVADKKDEIAAPVVAPAEQTVGDVPAEAVTAGEGSKSSQTVPTTA